MFTLINYINIIYIIYIYTYIYHMYTYIIHVLIERRARRVAYLRVLQDVTDAHCTMNICITYTYVYIYNIYIYINIYYIYICIYIRMIYMYSLIAEHVEWHVCKHCKMSFKHTLHNECTYYIYIYIYNIYIYIYIYT